jgi:hypothetical protein
MLGPTPAAETGQASLAAWRTVRAPMVWLPVLTWLARRGTEADSSTYGKSGTRQRGKGR